MAPTSSLYLHPGGWVGACCWSDTMLGRVTEDASGPGLLDIWSGTPMERLRAAIDHGDFSFGCQKCGEAVDRGEVTTSGIDCFEGFRGRERPEYPREIHFALSNTCNLMCVMCHGDLSAPIRAKREHRAPMRDGYGERFLADLRAFVPHLEQATFTGGEPFLCRTTRAVWDQLLELDQPPRVEVTTNGTQWSRVQQDYARRLKMNLLVSIDGFTAETVEAIRVGANHADVMANVDSMQEVVGSYGGTVTLNFCLMVQNIHEFGAFLADADRRDVDVSVRIVYSPPRFSLFELPPEELAGVVAALEEEGAGRRDELTRNRPIWDRELDRLRLHLDQAPSGAVAVEIGRRGNPEAGPRLLAEMGEWAGRPPLRLDLVDMVITGVGVPDWGADLGAEQWVGMGGLEMFGELITRIGPQEDLTVDQPEADILAFVIRLAGAGGPVTIRALRLEDVEDDRLTTIWMATPDPIPVAGAAG